MNFKFSVPCFADLKPTAPAREKILAAAAELLLTEGFHALTQHAVAARAGVRQSHLTYYFPTRNDLLRATAQYGIETLLAPIAGVTARADDGGEAALTVAQLRQLLLPEKSDRQWFRLLVGLLVASDEDATIRAWLMEFDQRIIKLLAAGFAAAGVTASEDQLHFLHCTLIGALHLDMKEQTEASFNRMVCTVEMALDSIWPPAPVVPVQAETPRVAAPATISPTNESTP